MEIGEENARCKPGVFAPVEFTAAQDGETMGIDVKEFFARYEKALAESDVPALAALYADAFLFGSPGGSRSVKKEDFLKVIPKRKEHFAALGLLASTVSQVEASELDAKYVMTRTVWTMRLRVSGAQQEIETSATYVLERNGEALTIVLQIDHQDLGAKVQEARLPE